MNKTSILKFKKNDHQRNMDLLVQIFQLNYNKIIEYLPFQQHHRLKSICRGTYYLSITHDIWFGLKVEVVDKKMQNFEDIDFIEEEHKIVTKQQKQIRIHSLKKNNVTNKLRQASNIKQKKVAITAFNNQMPFRSTQMGFKRLLKTNNHLASKQKINSLKQSDYVLQDLLEIPKQWSLKDLIINVKDPWSLNVHRASNLCLVVKKWNQFHHKLIVDMKHVQKDVGSLIKKCIRIDKQITDYTNKFEKQPYNEIKVLLQGSRQNLLIQEQLNKLGRIFLMNHAQLISISKHFQEFISKTHDSCLKRNKIQQASKQYVWILQYITNLQELILQYEKISAQSPQLIKIMSKSLFQIIDKILQSFYLFELQINSQIIRIEDISLSHISKKSDFFELLFESLGNCASNMLKLCQGDNSQNLGINLTAGKFKNIKVISHNLWNMAKYFTKIYKQLEAKEKKVGLSKQTNIIRNFLSSYDGNRQRLLDWKNPQKVQKEVSQLKLKVHNLKGMIQSD